MHVRPLLVLALLAAACGGATQDSKTAETTTSHTVEPTKEGTRPTVAPRDPKIAQLASAALSCKFEDEQFDEECPAYKAWRDEEDAFADGKGSDTIFSMMGDPDVKMRTLAVEHGVGNAATYFADHAKAARLFAMVESEKSTSVARSLVGLLTRLDADKLGLGSELVALSKSPSVAVRKALTSAIAYAQGPSTVTVITTLLNDPDREVQRSAISALSTGGITPAAPPVCKLLSEQIVRTDDLAGDALWSGSSSKCEGMHKAVLEELGKRVADLSKVTNAVGIGYELAASGVCMRTQSADLKKTGFQILKTLTTAAVKDPNTRSAAIGGLSNCDPVAAVVVARALTHDKDKFVAERAKKVAARRAQ